MRFYGECFKSYILCKTLCNFCGPPYSTRITLSLENLVPYTLTRKSSSVWGFYWHQIGLGFMCVSWFLRKWEKQSNKLNNNNRFQVSLPFHRISFLPHSCPHCLLQKSCYEIRGEAVRCCSVFTRSWRLPWNMKMNSLRHVEIATPRPEKCPIEDFKFSVEN